MSVFLVAGATGNVGSAVTRSLVAAGHTVRAVSRRAAQASLPGVEPVTADLDAPASLAPALQGVTGVFLLSGYADMPGLLAQVAAAGAERVVLLSSSSVPSGDLDNAVTEYHIRSEDAVRASGVAGTFLRPSMFMSNTLQWADPLALGDEVRVPFPGVAAAVLDPDDIGAVAATVLAEGGHEGPLRLTGPQALTAADRLRILGEALGRELRMVGLSDEESLAEMAAAGTPERYVAAFRKFYVDGELDESPVLPTVREVLGREPRDFLGWAAAHAGEFRRPRGVGTG